MDAGLPTGGSVDRRSTTGAGSPIAPDLPIGTDGPTLATATVPPHRLDALDLGALRLLLSVAELGSVAKAARRIGISQPSATVKLRKLERLVGVPLLDRTASGSRLTGGGARVADSARMALAAVGEVFREAERGRDGDTRVAIGATSQIADLRLADLLGSAQLANVVLDIVESTTRAVAAAVRNGRIDVGFVDGPFAPLGLRSLTVGHFELVAVVRPDHSLVTSVAPRRASDWVVDPEQVLEAGLLVPREGSGTRDVIEAAFAQFGFGVSGALIEVENAAGVIASMMTGRGVALVPAERAAALRRAGMAEVVRMTIAVEQPIRVCWTGTRPPHHVAAQIVDALETVASEP